MVQTVHNIDQDPLIIGHKKFLSRLMLGTGKYQSFREAKESILVSGCEILTVAVRRAQSSNVEGINNLLNVYPSRQNTFTDSGGVWDATQMGTNGAFYYTKFSINI